uniref:Contryphan-Fib n=1 Tax=Conus figulinus TaxID=101301 RepID=COWB_CONFI|nr:RecName: Full=Contryphan-Fib [Conus figulinus]
GCPWMPWC